MGLHLNVNNNKIDIRGYKSSWSQTINCNALGTSGSYHKYLDTGTGICPETKIVNGKDDFYKSRTYVHDQQQLIPTSIESFPNTSAGSDGNSVGRLQEFCMKRGASPPRYNERSCGVSGAGAGLFSVECVWSDIVTLGKATNKKEAKRRAAAEMLSKLSGTRSSQGCNNLASGNGDVHHVVSNGFTYEKNCSTRNIESASSPIREENYFSRPKEESYSKNIKEERMSLPNRNTTLHMNDIQSKNFATNGDSLSCSTEDREPSSPQKMDSRHESFLRKLSPNAQPFKPSTPSVSAPLSQRMSASTLQQTRSGPEAV